MLRSPFIRRVIVTLLLFVGQLTQFQTLYACELMEHDKPSKTCCCDEPGDMGKMACKQGGTCQDQSSIKAGEGCCNVSYEPTQETQASGTTIPSQQLLLLDAPQPPPTFAWFDFFEILPENHSSFALVHSSPSLPDKPVYFLTRRFRI